MITRLYISNFALIRKMEVSFPGSFTVITGETGAGKSIFLEALGLALGNRADLSVLDNKEQKCIVEAEFDVSTLDLRPFFEEYNLDYDAKVIVRREISAEGRSRSFVNDTAVQLATLKMLANMLVDIHSQHQTLMLNENRFQLDMVDAFAGTRELFTSYTAEFQKLQGLKKEGQRLHELEVQSRKDFDYYDFLFKELDVFVLAPGKLAELKHLSNTLENAETIKSVLAGSSAALDEGENNVLLALAQIKQSLASLSKYGGEYQQLLDRTNSVYLELKDICQEINKAGTDLQFDAARLDETNTALDRLTRLMKKHGVDSEEALLATKKEIENKLLAFSSLEAQISGVQKQVKQCTSKCGELAKELSKKRKAVVPALEKRIKQMLGELSMPNAAFKVAVENLDEPGLTGFDQVSFLFSANKGSELAELQKVASGGELSRLMLCLKALLAEVKKLPSIIFDEIDTGVSGEVAARIGAILNNMSATMQVIAITHLPQMASRGQHHLFVYKKDEGQRTNSYIKELQGDERIREIAKMLSAGKPGESALQNARELLSV